MSARAAEPAVSELIELTAAEAAAKLRAREIDAGELFEAYRARAAADELNAFTWVADDAPAADPDAPLAGLPLAVKDLFCTEGVPSQAGSKILEGYRPPYTATVVANAMRAGTTLLGKTNQDEFAMGSSNENSAFGSVLNPWGRGRVPGGSSGGSAAAVADGLLPFAEGTDGGGSIRIPSSWCNVYGYKASFGRVPCLVRPNAFGADTPFIFEGPITRNVEDAALALDALSGYHPRDSYSIDEETDFVPATRRSIKGWKIAYSPKIH